VAPLVLGHEVVGNVGGERCQSEATFPMAALVRRWIRLRGQFAYSRPDLASAVEILGEGDLGLDWLSDATLEAGAEAFANLVDRPAEYAKVMLAP
jgi:threonine dehydrogenase-like Zn-dependent dehydrogenase